MALKNGRCKYHGGLSTGPKTPEEKALDYLIHGDQSQYDKKAGLVLPDYLTVIDCDQL